MNNPLVSIITVTHNAQDYLEQTMRSVFSQTYQNVEYILIDGGSTDNTINIIATHESQITNYVSEKDKGIYDAMNKGIQRTKGKLIGMINAGDYYAFNAIETVLEAMLRHPNCGIFHGNMQILNVDGSFFKLKKPNQDLSQLFKGISLFHPTFFVKRTIYELNGLYDINFPISADFDFMLRNYLMGTQFHYIDHTIAFFRQGGYSERNKLQANMESRDILYKNCYDQVTVESLFKKWNAIYRKQKILNAGYTIARKILPDKAVNKIASYITNN